MKLEICTLVTVLGAVTATLTGGSEPSEPAAHVGDAIGHVMEQLLDYEAKFHIGMDLDDVEEATAGAADNDGTRFLPLGDTHFHPPGDFGGLVAISTINTYDEGEVDELTVILTHEADGNDALIGALTRAAAALELDLYPHDTIQHCWQVFEIDHPDDMWTIAFGDSVVVFEAMRVPLEEGEDW